ncbi:hypothetical protein ACP70R_009572 [Stipagrostis hirtigluma subsp. patula]
MAPPPLHRRRYLSPFPARLRPRRAPPPPLDLLTEPLGAESSGPDDAAAMADVAVADSPRAPPPPPHQHHDDAAGDRGHVLRRTRSGRAFPPPISVIGKGGRPWFKLRAHREGGRLVLREMRLPSQELLQPCKEDGRFKLLIHPDAGGRCCGGGTAGTARQQ